MSLLEEVDGGQFVLFSLLGVVSLDSSFLGVVFLLPV